MLGIKETFYPPAAFYDRDIRITIREIAGKAVEGRSIYGFFITEKELNKLFPKTGDYRVMPIGEFKGNIFKKGKDIYMERLFKELEIPVRKIRFWHILGWPFKK